MRVRTQQKMNKTFSRGSSLAQEMKQSLVGLLADSVCVSLKGQLIIQNSSKVLILAECLNWKPLYDGWWRGGRPSRKIKLHMPRSSLSVSAQSELMPRMRRKKCEEERIKAVNLKRIGKNKRCANSVLKLLRWTFEVEGLAGSGWTRIKLPIVHAVRCSSVTFTTPNTPSTHAGMNAQQWHVFIYQANNKEK